jgi:hypothetical protein
VNSLRQAKESAEFPENYQNCMAGINQVLKICWEIVNKSRNMNNENGKSQTTK